MNYNTYHKYSKGTRFRKPNSSKRPKRRLWLDRKLERHARLMAIGFIFGIALIIIFGTNSLISWIGISRIFAIIAVVVSFMPKKILPVIYRIKKELKVILCIFTISPILTGLVLLINFYSVSNLKTESYNVNRMTKYTNDYVFIVKLEDDIYKEHRQLRSFSTDDFPFTPDSVHYIVGKGLFRIKVVKDAYLTP